MKTTSLLISLIFVIIFTAGCARNTANSDKPSKLLPHKGVSTSTEAIHSNESESNIFASSANLDNWLGEYEYVALPENPYAKAYRITIFKEKVEYYAHVTVDGRQLGVSMRAIAQGDKSKISIILDYYLDSEGDIYVPETPYQNEFYQMREGDTLLQFEMHGNILSTYWDKLPVEGANQNFIKVTQSTAPAPD